MIVELNESEYELLKKFTALNEGVAGDDGYLYAAGIMKDNMAVYKACINIMDMFRSTFSDEVLAGRATRRITGYDGGISIILDARIPQGKRSKEVSASIDVRIYDQHISVKGDSSFIKMYSDTLAIDSAKAKDCKRIFDESMVPFLNKFLATVDDKKGA